MKTSRSDARKQAEEALRILDDTGENSIYRRHHEARCITALRALLAEQEEGGICEVCGDIAPLAPAPSPASDEVREALRVLLAAFLTLHRAYGTGSAEQWPEVQMARAALATRPAVAESDEVREAALEVTRGDWWVHYCPCCGATVGHGPECSIGRLKAALAVREGDAEPMPKETPYNGTKTG